MPENLTPEQPVPVAFLPQLSCSTDKNPCEQGMWLLGWGEVRGSACNSLKWCVPPSCLLLLFKDHLLHPDFLKWMLMKTCVHWVLCLHELLKTLLYIDNVSKFCKMLAPEEGLYWRAGSTVQVIDVPWMVAHCQGRNGLLPDTPGGEWARPWDG